MNNSSTRLYNVLMGNPGGGYNAIGRTSGAIAASGGNDNFFAKRGRSIENAFGTTGSAIVSAVNDRIENDKTDQLRKDLRTRMNDVAKGFGYNTWGDWQDAYEAARNAGDTAKIQQFEEQNKSFQAQANENAAETKQKADKYNDYRQNDYISNKINQDRGKFAGSAINTLSTAVDLTGLSSGPVSNAVQGGIEGIADELEQNGLDDFSWERAGQNAAIGATTGLVTGALNKGMSNALAKRGGNLFKGGNALTRGINNLGSKTALGRVGSTLATGAARGAVSGAVGGATGAGLQSAMNGVEFSQGVQNALQGAAQGAQQGAVTGGIMAGANMAISKTPGVGDFYNELQSTKSRWDQSGSNFDERLTNTLTSGDSAVGDWLMNKRQSNALGAAGNLGNRVQDVSGSGTNEYVKSIDPEQQWAELEEVMKRAVDSDTRRLYGASGGNNKLKSKILQTETTNDVLRMVNEKLKNNGTFAARTNGELDDTQYFGAVKDAINSSINDTLNEVELQRLTQQAPTTAKGWAKKAGQRIVEDVNNTNLGNRVKDVKLAEEAYNDGMSVLKSMSKADLRDELLNYEYTEKDLKGLSKNDLIEMLDETLPNGAEAYAGGNNSTGRVDAEEYVRSLTPESLREYMIREEGYSPDMVPKSKQAMLNRLKRDFVLQDLIGESYKPKSKYQQEYLVKGQDGYKSRLSAASDPDSAYYSRTNNDLINNEDYIKGYLGKNPGRGAVRNYNQASAFINDIVRGDYRYKSDADVIKSFNKLPVEAQENVLKIGRNWLSDDFMNALEQNATPTTAKGWLKQAGKRIVEDVNNSNLGNRVKDVSSDMPEDVRNMQIRDYNAYADGVDDTRMQPTTTTYPETNPTLRTKMFMTTDGDEVPLYIENWQTPREVWDDFVNSPEGASYKGQTLAGVTDLGQTTTRATVTQADPWDRVAQEAGYNNYDEVIQRYMEANPNAKINPRGMAGQVLTWMDQNPNTPTTAAGWAKRAGQRAVEDINNSNLGMRVRDVSQDTPDDIRNMDIRDYNSKQTEVFDSLTGKKTSAANKLRNAAGLKLQAQYGTIDKPTAKATNAPETLQKIANAGFTKPGDVERMADVITGSNGEVSKLVANLVDTARPINTFDGETDGQTINDYIDLAIQKRGLDGIREGKAVKSQLNALMRSLPSHAEGSISFEDRPTDVFKLTQLLDAEAANYEGRSGMNYGTTTPDKLRAAQVIKDVSNLYKNRLYDTVDVKQALTPEVAQNLKAYAPDNKAWADYVDNEIMSASSVKDLRSLQSPWVRAKKIIDNGYMNSVTYGGRNSGTTSNIPLTKRGVVGAVLGATVNSKPGLRLQAKALNKAADIVDGTQPETNPVVASPTELADMASNYDQSTQLYNAIGRTEGALNRDEAARNIANIAQEAEIVPSMSYSPANINNIATNMGGGSTSVYNALTGTPTTNQTTYTANTGYYQPTGDYWTDVIAGALTSAINDNDVEAFKTLYSMYQESLSNLNQNSNASNASSLNATQQAQLAKLDAADSAIDELETLFENAGGGKGPIAGNLQSLAGNIGWDSGAKTYNDLSEGLVNQISAAIGKTDSLNTEGEVKRALKLIPQLTDDAQTAKNKLEELRRMLATTKSSYNAAYGLGY